MMAAAEILPMEWTTRSRGPSVTSDPIRIASAGLMAGTRVAVIGAGIVGVSAATWLLRLGMRDVVLLDAKGPAAGASAGNAGVLASSGIVPVTTPGLLRDVMGYALESVRTRPRKPFFMQYRYIRQLLPFLVQYLSHANAADAARCASALMPLIGTSVVEHRALARGIPDAVSMHGQFIWMSRS